MERERAIHQAYLDEVAVQLDGKHLQRSSRRPWWTANATASLSRAVTNQSGKALAVLGINSVSRVEHECLIGGTGGTQCRHH